MPDTLKIAEDLESAGMTQPQAQAIARAIASSDYVTKDYLDAVLAKLETALLWKIATMILLGVLLQKYVLR
jgi:hypothetical protein